MRFMLEARSYQEILKTHLESRCRTNSRYSLRAFARDLGMSSGRLSEILNGKLGMSELAAKQVARRLGLSAEETDHFCMLVVASDARSRVKRSKALSHLAQLQVHHNEMAQLQLDAFKVISEWYHFALLELTTLKGFKSDAAWIARRLGITRFEVNQAIPRLKKLGLLDEKNGRLFQTEVNLATPSDVPSEALKNFHAQVLKKASDALLMQTVEERDVTNLTIAIHSKELPKLKQKIREFRREFNGTVESNRLNRDQVYMLAIQFFRLTEKE